MQAAIAEVTVHRNGALVVRRGTAEPGVVEVTGLPLLFSSDSLRVRATGGEVRDVEETCVLTVAPRPVPVGEEALRDLAEREARLDDELQTLATLLQAYEKLKPGEPGRNPPEQLPDAAAWIGAHAAAGEQLLVLEARRATLHRDKRALGKERRLLQRQDEGDRSPPRFQRGLRFVLDAEGAATVEIEYFVSAARWVPTYTLHLDGDRATLSLAALVAQASGEDWQGARLAFSTADLARETTLPELVSWRIGREQPQRRPSFRPLPGDLEELFHAYDLAKGPSGAGGPPPPRPAPAPPASFAAAPLDDLLEEAMDEDEDELSDDSAEMAVWDEPTGAVARELAVPSPSSAMRAPAPSQKTSMPPPGGMAKRRAAHSGGGEPPGVGRAAPEPLPPRLRHAYLRLQGPDEPARGTLRAVDATRHLWDLVQDHEAASVQDLHRAVDALLVAAGRIEHMTPPRGTSVVPAESFHHVHRARGEHDVPADGSYHRVLVDKRDADALVDFRTVPRESTDVFRYCTLRALTGAPLLPGPLHVYEDGSFRVTSRIDGSGGGQRLELNLGLEPALRVLGRTVQVEQQEKGLVTQRSRVSHEVTVRVRSGLPSPASLVLYDRLPVPDDGEKDIEVTLESAQPEPARDDKDPRGHPLEGGMRFSLTVPPGEKTSIVYTYVITLPAKAEVMGGNRRE